jgi:PST family polysaccharide transporter
LWESLVSLYAVHAFNYVVPLFTLPYLARVLGPLEWGALAFADAYGRVVGIVVEYGFGFSATREVAGVRHDARERSRQLADVLGAQILLGAFAVFATLVLAKFVLAFSNHRALLPGALFLALGQGASPMWYFQGIERVKLIGSVWIVGRIAAAIGIFLLVRSPGDGGLALFIQGGGPFLAVVAGLLLAYRDTPFLWPSLANGWRALRTGRLLFLYRAGSNLYTSMAVVLLGLVASPLAVAWFAGAEKIAKAAVAITGPVSQTFYPRLSHLIATDRHGDARNTAFVAMRLMISIGAGVGLLLFFGAPLLVRIVLGAGFEGSVLVLRVLALLPPLAAMSGAFGAQWMLAWRLDQELSRIILTAGVLTVVLSLTLGSWFQHTGAAIGLTLAEAFVSCAAFAVLWRRKLDPWRQYRQPREVLA